MSLLAAGILGGAAALAVIFYALRDNLVYFYTPSELAEAPRLENLRVGGLVAEGSVRREDAVLVFAITDGAARVNVRFEGLAPNLFAEGRGLLAEGILTQDGWFQASRLLAKHDENYTPRELMDNP